MSFSSPDFGNGFSGNPGSTRLGDPRLFQGSQNPGNIPNYFKNLGISNPFKNPGAGAASDASDALDQGRGQTEGVLGKMGESDTDYLNKVKDTTETYKTRQGQLAQDYGKEVHGLKDQWNKMADDAHETYTNSIQPQMKSIMERAGTQAGDAMTLKEAGDPNNSVQQAVRGMYENQAQGVNRTGLADVGVLQAMGTQATANQFGSGMPMTGGQLQALQGANLTQSGQAMANTQAQMQNLRTQGIQQGFDQSAAQYGRGQDAQNMAMNAGNAYGNAVQQGQNVQQQALAGGHNLGQEEFGVGSQFNAMNYGTDTGISNLAHGLNEAGNTRELGAIQDQFGGKAAVDTARMGAAGAAQAGMFQGLGGLAGGVASGVGSYFGGHGGDAAAADTTSGSAGATGGSAALPEAASMVPELTDPNERPYQPQNPYQYGTPTR